jgi:hypothetical protein
MIDRVANSYRTAEVRKWHVSTNEMGRIVGSYLGVHLTQLPPTASALRIMQNT